MGRDAQADAWLREQYDADDNPDKPPFDEVYQDYQGYYVIELAPEQDSVPVYRAFGQDENVFRGQFLADCQELIGEDLLNEAWSNHLAEEAVDYAHRLIAAVTPAAQQHGLEYLKDQYEPPEAEPESLESQLHIVYSLARWLIFYGSRGHGYEADF